MDYRDIQELRAFFSAIRASHYKQTLKEIPNYATVDGQQIPVHKDLCLELLRKLPQFQGDEFKDGNAIVKFLSDPMKRSSLFDDFKEGRIELTEALEEKPIAASEEGEQAGTEMGPAEQAPVGEATSTMGMPGLPSAPSISFRPQRIIRNIPPSAPLKESKLYIANKSGRVVQERTITPSSTTITKPEPPSKILIANKGGVVAEAAPSKIFIANKSEVVTGEHKIPRASRFNFPAFKSSFSSFAKGFKNFGSRAGLFFQRNVGKFLTIGRVATVASAGIGVFAGATFGGPGMFAGGIGGAILPSWVKSGGAGKFFERAGNGVVNFGARLFNQVGKGGLKFAGSKGGLAGKKIGLIFLVAFMLLAVGGALLGAFSPGGSGTSPTGTTSTASRLTLSKSGPGEVAVEAEIAYELTLTFTGTGTANIEVSDKLPDQQVEFKSASDGGTNDSNTAKWTLSDVPANTPKKISLVVTAKPGVNDYAQNTAEAKIVGTSGGTSPGGTTGVIDINNTSLAEIFSKAATNANIPLAFLKAIGSREGDVLTYNAVEVIKFSTPRWWQGLESEAARLEDNHPDIKRGYGYNTCKYRPGCPRNDVRGPMQFEFATWEGVKPELGPGADRRNLTEAVFGAAIFLKRRATVYNYALGPDWDERTVKAMARAYCGGNPNADVNVKACISGGRTYDDLVWDKYLEYRR